MLSVAVLVALAYPALSLHIAKPSDLALAAQSDPALRTLADVRRAFPSAGEDAAVVVTAPAAAKADLARQLARLRTLAVREGIARTPVEPIRTGSSANGDAGAACSTCRSTATAPTAPAARPSSGCASA